MYGEGDVDNRKVVFNAAIERAEISIGSINYCLDKIKHDYKDYPELAQAMGYIGAAKDAMKSVIESLKKEKDEV